MKWFSNRCGAKRAGRFDHSGGGAGVFRWLARLAQIDLAASGALTRQHLGWNPIGPDLLTDLRNMDYSVS